MLESDSGKDLDRLAVLLITLILFPIACTISTTEARPMIIVPDNYSTVASAIDHAMDGDIIFLKSGNYKEHTLVINKQLTLIGESNSLTSIENIDSNNESVPTDFPWTLPPVVAIEVRSNDVIITNLTIKGNQRFMPINASADRVSIINNIFNPKSEGITLQGNHNTIAYNTLAGQGHLGLNCNGSYNVILNNDFSGLDNGAIFCRGSNNAILGNRFSGERSSPTIDLFGSSNIIYENHVDPIDLLFSFNLGGSGNIIARNNFTDGTIVLLDSNNSAIGNTIGVLDVIGINHIVVANNVSYGVELGTTVDDASNITLYHNNFYFQPIEARPIGDRIFEVWSAVKGPVFLDNGVEGNYWSDYSGHDANGDGIGDSPYIVMANDSRNYEFAAVSDISNIVMTDYHPLMAAFDIRSISFELPPWVNSIPELADLNPQVVYPIHIFASAGLLVAIASVAIAIVYRKKTHQGS